MLPQEEQSQLTKKKNEIHVTAHTFQRDEWWSRARVQHDYRAPSQIFFPLSLSNMEHGHNENDRVHRITIIAFIITRVHIELHSTSR